MHSIIQRLAKLPSISPFLLAILLVALAAACALLPLDARASTGAASPKPTVVLVHGAFAESSSWDKVAYRLLRQGYRVVAAANPLRSLKTDAAYVSSVIDALDGPVILVGHSYGGSVISNAAIGRDQVKALVYVAGFAPDEGESVSALAGKFPGSTLGGALAPPLSLGDGNKDLYIRSERFRDQFAADVSFGDAALMAVTQRPITDAAIDEPAGKPAWKTVPSWFIYGSLDKNVPPAAQDFMAKRAGAKRIVVVNGASHVVMVSHPDAVAALVGEAARAVEVP